MGMKPRPRELLQRVVDAVADAHGNQAAAARNLGIPKGTVQHIKEQADADGILPYVKPPKPKYFVPPRSTYIAKPKKHGKAMRVFVFGCAHDAPQIGDKSRFLHAGRLAADLAPDYIVDLGDTLDLDSLSVHATPGSAIDRERAGFLTEMDSLDEAIAAFNEAAPSAHETPRYHCHGNHEYRAFRFEMNNPTTDGVYTLPLNQIFARYGFTTLAYREWFYLEGVGFTHAPINGMGKEYAGKFPDQMIAQDSTHSVVWSHTHKSTRVHRPKVGIGNSIDVFNTGSFMPQGYLKQYAGLSTTGWTYGAHELTLRDGGIESVRTWSELELRERFA